MTSASDTDGSGAAAGSLASGSPSWCWATARQIADAVRSGTASAVEIARAHLDRIARLDENLGSFLLVDEAGALARAAEIDAAVAAGQAHSLGPLAGVPVALKDLLVTRGLRTTAGSRILGDWIPPYDSTVATRLREAGAVLLGKLNLDEFAMGSSNESSAFHPCRNPWDLGRVPGGSSGGSAAAVAAGLCTIALGTDTGGSIRQPAALCGCVGIKPTYGRVSRWGAIAFASSLDQIGPLARTVEDCALALQVIAGFDPLDATSIDAPVPPLVEACHAPLDGMRVGVPEELFGEGLDADVERAVRAAIARLGELGARIVPTSLPHARHALAAYYLIAPAEASSNLARYDGVRYGLRAPGTGLADTYANTRATGFGDEVKRRIMLGTYALRAGYYDAYYLRAQKVRALIAADYARAFESCDVLAAPTSPVVAFPLGARRADPLAMYLADVCTISCNLAGLPGLSVPCGFAPGGDAPDHPPHPSVDPSVDLPVGLQLVGPPLGEAAILHAAAQYQRATDWHTRRPAAVERAAGASS